MLALILAILISPQTVEMQTVEADKSVALDVAFAGGDQFLSFAAEQESDDVFEIVDLWRAIQPATYGGIRQNIKERRRNKQEVERDRKTINEKIIDRKKANANVQVAKADKWDSFGWAMIALAILIGVVFTGLTVNYIVRQMCN